MDIFEMRKAVAAKVEASYVRAEQFYGMTFKRPKIEFKKQGTTAGTAHYNGKLNFNEVLMRENFDHFLKQTVPHEVAHLVSVERYGFADGKGHGRCWKSVMSSCFGLSPDRCHTYDTTNVAPKTVRRLSYACSCRTHDVTLTVHNRIMKGKVYRCNSCKTPIKLITKKVA